MRPSSSCAVDCQAPQEAGGPAAIDGTSVLPAVTAAGSSVAPEALPAACHGSCPVAAARDCARVPT
jgi:hypothetical protein